jgi:hypothetical protein
MPKIRSEILASWRGAVTVSVGWGQPPLVSSPTPTFYPFCTRAKARNLLLEGAPLAEDGGILLRPWGRVTPSGRPARRPRAAPPV